VLDELPPAEPMQWGSEKVRLAWMEEIAPRIAAYQRGEVQTMAMEEVAALLEAEQREGERRAGEHAPRRHR
jgi:hypothetical protein